MNNVPHQTRRAAAFTIMELIVVIVIIGVLAAIAIPSYRIQMLKMENQEAIRVLMTLWEAQKDYYRENGTYFSGDRAAINSTLRIDIPQLKNFAAVYATDRESFTCSGGTVYKLAKLVSRDNTYNLFVIEDGHIRCKPCGSSVCVRMGFTWP